MNTPAERVASGIDARQRQKQAEAESRYRQLVDDMAKGVAIDEEAAAITCDMLGKSSDQVRADVGAHAKRIKDADRCLGLPSALEEMLVSIATRDAYDRETERIMAERKAGKQAAYDRAHKGQHDYLTLGATIKTAIDDASPQLRAAFHALQEDLPDILKQRIAALDRNATATAALESAKLAGLKKTELAPLIAEAETTSAQLAAADGLVADWLDAWTELHNKRLSEPPSTTTPPAPVVNPFGPGLHPQR